MNTMSVKSVKSINPCESLPCRQAGVIQTIYDIVKIHWNYMTTETLEGAGSTCRINLTSKIQIV
jgi:hypothetical protein